MPRQGVEPCNALRGMVPWEGGWGFMDRSERVLPCSAQTSFTDATSYLSESDGETLLLAYDAPVNSLPLCETEALLGISPSNRSTAV